MGDECCRIITDQNAPTLPLTASMKAEAYHAESFDSKPALHCLIAAVWSTFFSLVSPRFSKGPQNASVDNRDYCIGLK